MRNEIVFKYPWQSFSSKVRKVKYDSFLWITLISDYLEPRSIGDFVVWTWKKDREKWLVWIHSFLNEIIQFSDNKKNQESKGFERVTFRVASTFLQSTAKSLVVTDRIFQLILIHASDSLNLLNSMKDYLHSVCFNFEMAVILIFFQFCNLFFMLPWQRRLSKCWVVFACNCNILCVSWHHCEILRRRNSFTFSFVNKYGDEIFYKM